MTTYAELFRAATGFDPYPYQVDFATRDELPCLVSVPTGCGKTAAVILGWLWRRRFANPEIREATPRRLVYCLPMRVLVEQTRDCAVTWLHRLTQLGGEACFKKDESGSERLVPYDRQAGADDPEKIRVHVLLGGDVDRDWDMFPERDAILVGTQDMLLSRALNRGYAMSRFRWPVLFGLLNNDCLWVMDEVQLMGSGLATTAQLQAFRRKLGTASGVRSVWMSATMRADWLATVDFDQVSDAPGGLLEIGEEDKDHQALRPTFEAVKRLERAEFEVTTDGKAEAELARGKHTPGTRTLVIANTVKRAQTIYRALKAQNPPADLVLIHSRFRPSDREAALVRLLAKPGENGIIGICTQVVEAGVDVSAKTLITDLAPWASLVQRFGRCNRKGEFNQRKGATVIWISPPNLDDDKKLKPAPYLADQLRSATAQLEQLADVGPVNLPSFEEPIAFGHVVRRKDIVELFDTTPDLAGADIDVSRFIREADEHDVQVFWRDLPKEGPGPSEKGPAREELCSVPVHEIEPKDRDAWRWDHLEKEWAKVKAGGVYPGLLLLLRSEQGGYSPEFGWTGRGDRTDPAPTAARENEANDDDPQSQNRAWKTIAEHTDDVVAEVRRLLSVLPLPNVSWREGLRVAARWHDAGKSHHEFQAAMKDPPRHDFWGKAVTMGRYGRPGFRHELASALVMLQHGLPDLAAYLAAAHHGKVRLSIRSLPHEKHPEDMETRFARGVWEGDTLPQADLGGGIVMYETVLKLAYMELGEDDETGPSWLARMLALRDELGPFRLAILEALLRVADWRASENDEEVQG